MIQSGRACSETAGTRLHLISLPETLSLCNERKVSLKASIDVFSRFLIGLAGCDCAISSRGGGYERQPPKLLVTDK